MTLALAPFNIVRRSPTIAEFSPAELDDREFVLIDLRSPAAVNDAGWALVQYSGAAPASHVVLSTGENPADLKLNGRERAAWNKANDRPAMGDTLADWIDNKFGTQADHTGATGSRPAWPRARQSSILFGLGPYSFRRPFSPVGGQSPTSPHSLQLQSIYAATRARAGAIEARKWLQRVVEDRCLKGRQHEAIQAAFVADGPPLPHSTVIAESFNKANSTTLGPDQAWTEHLADFSVSSNSLAFSQSAHGYCSANVDLGTDHYAIASMPGGTWLAGPTTRTSATDGASAQPCCYATYCTQTGGLVRLRKYTAGQTFAEVASVSQATPGVAFTLKLTANGSSLVVAIDGVDIISATDTTLAVSQRCGCFIYSTTPRIDSWEAGDCGAAGGSHCYGSSIPAQIDWER